MRALSDFIFQQRHRQVVMQALPHLEGGEEVIGWARVGHPEDSLKGYAFLTSSRLLVVWAGHSGGHPAVEWGEIRAWGVSHEAAGGPVLGVESPRSRVLLHLPITGQGTARRVSGFLHRFARLAPRPRRRLAHGGFAAFEPDPTLPAMPDRRSAGALARRVVVTVLGVLLVVGGLLITPIPGPWSLPVVLAGLAVLASEYDWAQDTLEWIKDKTRETRDKLRARRAQR